MISSWCVSGRSFTRWPYVSKSESTRRCNDLFGGFWGISRSIYIYIYSITINYIHIIDIKNSGLLRTNIAPAKRSFEKGTHLPTRLCGMLFFEGCTVS